MADDNATGVFVYTGVGEGDVVPHDIVRVRIDQLNRAGYTNRSIHVQI